MSKAGRGRGSFVYSTARSSGELRFKRKRSISPEEAAAGATATSSHISAAGSHSGSHSLVSKAQRTEPEFVDDDFDDIGAAALEQFELTQRTSTSYVARQPESHVGIVAASSATKWSNPYQKDSQQPTTTNPSTRSASPLSFQQAMEKLQEENFTKDGEVKLLRDKTEKLLKDLSKREEQIRLMQARFSSERKELETHYSKENSSLSAKLQFKEQEVSALRDKCLLLEQHSKSPGTTKPLPSSKPVKTKGTSSGASTDFLSTETFMASQTISTEVNPVPVKLKRNAKERSVSISDKKPETKLKKARVSRSPTTTPSDTLSGRRGSKSSKSSSPKVKPVTPPSIDPSLVLNVQSKELDNTQLLMLLIRRDLLEPPVFQTTEESEVTQPLPVVSTERDSQSSDEGSPPPETDSAQSSLTGLLSLLRVQPKSALFSGSLVTPIRNPDTLLKDSFSGSDSSPTHTPVMQKKLQLSKTHSLARTDGPKSRQEQPGASSLAKSVSASDTQFQGVSDKRMSSLLYSVDKSGLEKSIGVMIQSADLTTVSQGGSALSVSSFCPNLLYSRMPESSNLDLLKRIATIVLQYHDEQSVKAKGTANANTSDLGDSAESSISVGSHKSISSSGGSKVSSELFIPLKCDQQLVSQSLEILETLVSYCPSLREQILLQPPKFSLDSQPGSTFGTAVSSSISSSLDVRGEHCDRQRTLVQSDLEEVSRRLSFAREGSASPVGAAKTSRLFMDSKVWKDRQLANIHCPSCSLSCDTWIHKENTPQDVGKLEMSFSVPGSRCGMGCIGGLFNVLMEMPAPPWRESPRIIVACLKILTALAEDCSVDALQQFSPLLEEDVIGVCLDKEDPAIVLSTLSLLTPLLRSPLLVALLCRNSPCVPVSCYDITLQTLPDSEHRHSGYSNQLQVVRLISEALVTENGPSVLLSSPSCQCHHELLKTLVTMLSSLIDSVQETSHWTQEELTLVLEVVSLMHKISIHDNYFDTHLMECEHMYTSVHHSLSWLLPSHHAPLREIVMVTDLLEYVEEIEDSEEMEKMDTSF